MNLGTKFKKIITIVVLLSVVGSYFVLPLSVKKANAFLGIGDITSDVLGFAQRLPQFAKAAVKEIAKVALQRLKERLILMLTNDITNWIQNGGKPRFVQDPLKFLGDAANQAAGQTLNDLFRNEGINVCRPFRASLEILVQRSAFPNFRREERFSCSLTDAINNLQDFADDFRNGSWTTWARLHETRNSLVGTYLEAGDLIASRQDLAQNTASVEIAAGSGFLSQKLCVQATVPVATAGRATLESIDPESFESFIETGVQTTVEDYPGGKPLNQLPPGAVCTKQTTITPAAVIERQISGTLHATGIEKLINAREAAEVISAIIDSMVNRVAREGLALVRTGRGSYTRPARASYRARSKTSTDTRGLEGIKAVEFLNSIVGLKTKVETLIQTGEKLIARENKITDFEERLAAIAQRPDGRLDRANAALVRGASLARCGKSRRIKNIGDVIDLCMFGALGDPSGISFDIETNNPGPFYANQSFAKNMKIVWDRILDIFRQLDTKILAIENKAAASPSTCDVSATANLVPDIRYTFNVEEIDNSNPEFLPFFDGVGTVFRWFTDKGYIAVILSDFDASNPKATTTTAADWGLYLETTALIDAEIQSDQAQQTVETYDTLIASIKIQKESLEEDIQFVNNLLPTAIRYATILADYDRAGRTVGLLAALRAYNNALTENNDTVIETAQANLLAAQERTRTAWRQIQLDIINSPTASTFEKDRAQAKLPVISEAVSLVEASLVAPPEEETVGLQEDTSGDFTQIGLSPSEAVAKALAMDLQEINNELELRDSKVDRQSTEVSSTLGKFLTDPGERKTAGIEGGASEWQKYAKNRFQFVYLSLIHKFYSEYFLNRINDIATSCGI